MFIVVFLLSFSVFAKGHSKVPIIEMKDARALYVMDGDSISLSMRIKGIDTPEKRQKCRKVPSKIINCGTVSKEYLQVLLNNLPGELSINPVGIGYYGRILVQVYKGSVDVGKMMVEDGIAYAYGTRYKTEQAHAKAQRKGFWGFHTPPLNPKKWRKRYMKKF